MLILNAGCSKSSNSTGPDSNDDTRPYVISHFPATSVTNISRTPEIKVVFSEKLAASSVTDSSIILTSGQRIQGTVTLSDSTIRFIPTGQLAIRAIYEVRISGALTDIRGNHVRDTLISRFSTEPYSATTPECWVKELSIDPDGAGIGSYAIAITRDNAIVAAGGDNDPAVAKVDTDGNILWLSEFSITPYEHGHFTDIAQRTNGAFVMVGDRTDIDAPPGSGYGASLTLVTEGGIAGTGFDKILSLIQSPSVRIQTTVAGGYVISGTSTETQRRFRLMETDYFGAVLWQHSLGADVPSTPEYYNCEHSTTAHDGGYVLCGYRHFGDVNNTQRYMVKTDDTGAVVWENTFGTGKFRTVCQADGDGYYVTGDNVVMRVSSEGAIQWESATLAGLGYGLTLLSDGNLLVCGMTVAEYAGNMVLAKFDPAGGLMWRKEPMAGGLLDVAELPDGSLVACGFGFLPWRGYGALLKTDEDGNL